MTILRTKIIGHHMDAAVEEFREKYDAIMNGDFHGELVSNARSRPIMKSCKELAKTHVFSSPKILKLEVMGRGVIRDLMDLFWEGAEARNQNRTFGAKIYPLFSENYRAAYEFELKKNVFSEHYLRLQLVADHICGMTDSYACNLHRELTNG